MAIVGYAPPDENRAGHDLTYQASAGLLDPPEFPRIPLADYAGSERAVSATLALLWERDRTGHGGQTVVSMVDALRPYAHALCYGLLAPGTLLGGASPLYGLYRTRDGWVALAALEPHFRERIKAGLGIESLTSAAVGRGIRHPHLGRVGPVGEGAGRAVGGCARAGVSVNATLTAVPGIKVGHADDLVGMTGCTVVRCEGARLAASTSAGARRERARPTCSRPMHLVTKVHAVVLAGGSAFGLAAADGAVRYLRERQHRLQGGQGTGPNRPSGHPV